MRLISVKAFGVRSSQYAETFRRTRELMPSAELGQTIAAIKGQHAIVELETDDDEACEKLNRLIAFVTALSDMGVSTEISQLERLPGPMDQPPPESRITTIRVADLQRILAFEEELRFQGLPPHLEQFLRRFDEADWHQHVGEPLDADGVKKGSSRSLPTENWLDVILEAQNRLTETLCFEHPYHYNRTYIPLNNSIDVKPIVACKLANLTIEFRDFEMLVRSLELVLHQACMESFYAHLIPTSFGVEWASWLLRGRLPCGWQGRGLDGVLIIV